MNNGKLFSNDGEIGGRSYTVIKPYKQRLMSLIGNHAVWNINPPINDEYDRCFLFKRTQISFYHYHTFTTWLSNSSQWLTSIEHDLYLIIEEHQKYNLWFTQNESFVTYHFSNACRKLIDMHQCNCLYQHTVYHTS